MRVDIDVDWNSHKRVWWWTVSYVTPGGTFEIVAEGFSAWRWLARRRATSELVAFQHQRLEDERNAARKLHFEVDL